VGMPWHWGYKHDIGGHPRFRGTREWAAPSASPTDWLQLVLSTNRKRKPKWRPCVAASIAVGPSAIRTGSRTRPSDWGSNVRFGPAEDRRNNRRLAPFTCSLCVLQIWWLSPFTFADALLRFWTFGSLDPLGSTKRDGGAERGTHLESTTSCVPVSSLLKEEILHNVTSCGAYSRPQPRLVVCLLPCRVAHQRLVQSQIRAACTTSEQGSS
jgi:hypothetical protein